MTPAQYLEAVTADSAAMAAVTPAELDAPIAFLGDWTVRDLLAHTGAVYAMAAANVAAATTEPTAPGDEATAPDEGSLLDWFGQRRQVLLDTLGAADPSDEAWTFAGVQTTGFWMRRMAQETTVHLWDMRAGVSSPEAAELPDSDLSTDGIDEYTEVGLRFSSRRPNRVYPAETLHLHRTDGPGEWMLARGATEHDVVVTAEHGKGDAAVRGPAANLLLWIWGRPIGGIELFGDPGVADAWQAVAP